MEVPKGRQRDGVAPGAPRRVATAPMTLQSRPFDRKPSSSGDLVETLYHHPNARIVAFTTSGSAFSNGSADLIRPGVEQEPGSLPWSSRLERTIAVGVFRIYRAPGSVAFLNSGSALQPILPKSQCWCIDEINSKFVLQVRRPNYWRIELPVSTAEDRERALALRTVFASVLQFEKTECPFQRAFTVELPELPPTPTKKKPWKPVRQSLPSIESKVEPPEPEITETQVTTPQPTTTPATATTTVDSGVPSPTEDVSKQPLVEERELNGGTDVLVNPEPETAEIQECDAASKSDGILKVASINIDPAVAEEPLSSVSGNTESSRPSPNVPAESLEPIAQTSLVQKPSQGTKYNVQLASVEDDGNHTAFPADESHVMDASSTDGACTDPEVQHEAHEGQGSSAGLMKVRLRRTYGFGLARSVTSPSRLPPVTPSTPLGRTRSTDASGPDFSGNESSTGSHDSFHSVQSWLSPDTPLPPTPPISYSDWSLTPTQPRPDRSPSPSDAHYERSNQRTLTRATGESWVLLSKHANEGPEGSDGNDGSRDSNDSSRDSVTTVPDTDPRGGLSSSLPKAEAGAAATPVHAPRPKSQFPTSYGGTTVRRRALSPLPPAATLFAPLATLERPRQQHRSRLHTVKKLPMAILNRTYEILLGPPSHLIALMLRVAARLAAGEWKGVLLGYGANGEQIPVQWDYSEDDISEWGDDDGLHAYTRKEHQAASPASIAAD